MNLKKKKKKETKHKHTLRAFVDVGGDYASLSGTSSNNKNNNKNRCVFCLFVLRCEGEEGGGGALPSGLTKD